MRQEPLSREDAIKKCYKNLGPFESMYILAELEQELQLFTIKYRSADGLLLVYPDFNNIDVNPYLKEINLDSRHLYQYSIENLSNELQNDDWLLKTDIDAIANKVGGRCQPDTVRLRVLLIPQFQLYQC